MIAVKIFKSELFRRMFPYFLLALLIIIAYKAINELSFFLDIIGRIWGIITPFFYGFILAYLINIPCGAIQRWLGKSKIKFISKRKNGIGIFVVLILFVLVLAFILYLIIPSIQKSISLFIANLPLYYERTRDFTNYINDLELFGGVDISMDGILNMLQERLQSFSIERLSSSFETIMGISSAIFGVSSVIFKGFLTIISSVYFLVERDKITRFFSRLVKTFSSSEAYETITKFSTKLNKNFKQYINTQTIDGCILGTIATLELLFIIRSPYALVLGIMLGIINYIPYFGSIIGSIAAVLIVAFTQDITMAALAAVILLVTQQIDGNIIQPKLMGGSFKLSPILVIISITVGGAFAGIIGMIAAIPIVAVMKDILEDILLYYERQKIAKAKTARELHDEDD